MQENDQHVGRHLAHDDSPAIDGGSYQPAERSAILFGEDRGTYGTGNKEGKHHGKGRLYRGQYLFQLSECFNAGQVFAGYGDEWILARLVQLCHDDARGLCFHFPNDGRIGLARIITGIETAEAPQPPQQEQKEEIDPFGVGYQGDGRVLKPGAIAYIGRGFSRNLPVATAKKIRAKQGKKMKYNLDKAADELQHIMNELQIKEWKIHRPNPPGSDNVNYGLWVEFHKPID